MAELANCPKCGDVYVENNVRGICPKCWKQEEADYEKVYQFIRKKQNRTAEMDEVVEATGVERSLIYKFIKKGRIKLAQFPNLGYPCAKCGAKIREGKLCSNCLDEVRTDLKKLEVEEERKQEIANRKKDDAYRAINKKNR
ncbi:TIGR03826 family flagellar region protein [Niallia sp. 03091]|uniref:TIGR03826 family flagellar region protein n=1 Tax=unclassified Niallia TaxID=2837522 RepID=UPI0040448A40